MQTLPDLSVAILAGGQSSRMHQDKALKPFLGQPLIVREVDRLRPLGVPVVVITNRPPDYAFLNLPLYPDRITGAGLLCGLYTALYVVESPLLAVVACDMPFLSPRLLAAQRDLLLSEAVDVVIPRSPDGLEPTHIVARRETCLPAVLAAIESGQRRMISWLPAVNVREMTEAEIAQHDPGFYSFTNVNTPEEFQQAEELALRLAREEA